MKPIVAEHKPETEFSKPDADMPQHEGKESDTDDCVVDPLIYDTQVRLFALKSDIPSVDGSKDMRGVKGGLNTIKGLIRTIHAIRNGNTDRLYPYWYTVGDDILYTISTGMLRDAELKEYINYDFVTLEG